MSCPPLRSSSLRPLAFILFGAVASLGTGFAGCGDSSTGDDPPAECEGGVIIDGVCEGKCTPDKCLEGNVCVGNRCLLQCTAHTECYAPFRGDSKFQGCFVNQADTDAGLNDGDAVYVCTDVNLAPNLMKPCPIGDECDDPNSWTFVHRPFTQASLRRHRTCVPFAGSTDTEARGRAM